MVLNRNQLLHFSFIGLLHGEGMGHHLLDSTRTVIILHRLQNAIARVQILLTNVADLGKDLLRFRVLQHRIQLAQNHRDMLADLFKMLLRLCRVRSLFIQQHELLSANKFLEVVD